MELRTGFAIAIAWPEFMGKQAGSWYDLMMRILGMNKNYHYQVGHASLILINSDGKCYYFDCGRYEAPYQKGRIRGESTDCGLRIKTKAMIQDDKILNIKDILTEVQLNESCKGFGTLKAAYCSVNFDTAYSNVKRVQDKGIISFGPFVRPGTNCCRFVQKGILDGVPRTKYNWRLRFLFPLLPKPLTIIQLMHNQIDIPEKEQLEGYKDVSHLHENLIDTRFCYNKTNVNSTLEEPLKPINVPSDAQWLGGEMAGSWFQLTKLNNSYFITRYSENGAKECSNEFRLNSESKFEIDKPYSFSYLTHCSKSNIIQGNKVFEFTRL
jgi:hypothetical protein